MDFDLAISNRGDTCIVSVSGDVDVYTAPRLDSCLQCGITSGKPRLVVDLAQCTYLDSEGIKVLIRSFRMAGCCTQLVICGAWGIVRRVLEISGLSDHLRIVPSINDLQESVSS